jgi:hypothetical protein
MRGFKITGSSVAADGLLGGAGDAATDVLVIARLDARAAVA